MSDDADEQPADALVVGGRQPSPTARRASTCATRRRAGCDGASGGVRVDGGHGQRTRFVFGAVARTADPVLTVTDDRVAPATLPTAARAGRNPVAAAAEPSTRTSIVIAANSSVT